MSTESRSRRSLTRIAAAAVAGALLLAGCTAPAQAPQVTTNGSATQTTKPDGATTPKESLASWTAGSASLKKLTDYVEAATTEGGKGYVAPEDRIAVFDLDGTLMCETYPWCFEYMVFADYALNNPGYEAPDDVKAVAQEIVDSAWGKKPEKMSTRQAQAAAVAYAGMTPKELEDYVGKFKDSPAEGYKGFTYP